MPYVYLFNWQLNVQWNLRSQSVELLIECTCEISIVHLFHWQLKLQWNVRCPYVQLTIKCTLKYPMSICYIDNCMYIQWNVQCPFVKLKTECTLKCPISICSIDNWLYSEISNANLYKWQLIIRWTSLSPSVPLTTIYNEMSYVHLFNWQLNVQWNVQCPSVHLTTECTMKCPMSICNIDNWMYNELTNVHL